MSVCKEVPSVRAKSAGWKLLAVGAGLLFFAAACGSSKSSSGGSGPVGTAPSQGRTTTTQASPPSQSKGKNVLVDGQNFGQGDPDFIDPGLADTLQGAQIPKLVYVGLTDSESRTGKTIPRMATSWTAEQNGKVWVFHIRPGVRFSDGTPVLPHNFKQGWERACNPSAGSQTCSFMYQIQGGQDVAQGKAKAMSGLVADDRAMTLTVTLTEPFANFPTVVQHVVFSPVPDSAMRKPVKTYDDAAMIGNGPFMMKGPWKHGQEIDLVANPSYSPQLGPQPKIHEVDFKISSDVNSAYNAFKAGQFDTAVIPPGTYPEALKFPHDINPNLGVYYFAIGQDVPFLGGQKNLKLREAISLAINRTQIDNTIWDGTRPLATSFTPKGVPGAAANLCSFCSYDKSQAKKLYSDWKNAGNKLPHPIEVQVNANAGHDDLALIIVQNLNDVGIPAKKVDVSSQTWTQIFGQQKQGCQICRAGWIWDYPDLDDGLYPNFSTGGLGENNFSKFNDPKFDQLISQARSTLDATARYKLYNQAEKLVLDDAAMVPIVWYNNQVVYNSRIHNFRGSLLQFYNYDTASVS